MKIGDIQADRVFPITEELQEELNRREQRRQAAYQNRRNNWMETSPLRKLPLPLRAAVQTVIHAAVLLWLIGYFTFYTSRKRRKKRP